MTITKYQKALVEAKIAECMLVAERYYAMVIATPSVDFDLKGGCAGKATPSKHHISLNGVLLVENFEAYLEDTIPHEVAHIVCHVKYGWLRTANGGISHHGKEWKAIMRALGAEPTRCHNMDVSNVKRKMRQFSYFCPDCLACVSMSIIRHNRVTKGTKSYSHKSCTSPLEFIEEIK